MLLLLLNFSVTTIHGLVQLQYYDVALHIWTEGLGNKSEGALLAHTLDRVAQGNGGPPYIMIGEEIVHHYADYKDIIEDHCRLKAYC